MSEESKILSRDEVATMHSGTLAPRVEYALQCRKALLFHDDALRAERDTALERLAEISDQLPWTNGPTIVERAKSVVMELSATREDKERLSRELGISEGNRKAAEGVLENIANFLSTDVAGIPSAIDKFAGQCAEALTRAVQIIYLVEHTVADDFCEDLDTRAEGLTGDAKVMHQKLSFLYRIAHSARGDAVCYGRHDDWRKEADEAIAALQSVETPEQKGKTDESNR